MYLKPSLSLDIYLEMLENSIISAMEQRPGLPWVMAGDMNSRIGEIGLVPQELASIAGLLVDRTSLDRTTNSRGTYDASLDSEFTLTELQNALKSRKDRKAPGSDGISYEFLKNLPPNWILYLNSFFNMILEKCEVPSAWCDVIFSMLHKGGSFDDSNNYRSIALVNCVAKLFTQILLNRLLAWEEKHERLLLLPKSTSSALVRLETGTIHIALFVFKVTLNFLLNILSMSPKRLPKICLNRLLALHNSECAYNWVLAIKSVIIDLGHPELWNNLNFTQLKRHKPILLEKLKEKLHQEDLDIALSSSYTVFYTQLTITHDPTNHLNFKMPIYVSRILSQLRLSNNKYCAFHIKGLKYIFRPTEICTVCNNFDFETVEHILIKCPLYKEVRPNSWTSLNAIIDILNSLTPGSAKQVCKSFFAILKLRAFLLNE
nr:unnamed protein product [Callosobruchus analis]